MGAPDRGPRIRSAVVVLLFTALTAAGAAALLRDGGDAPPPPRTLFSTDYASVRSPTSMQPVWSVEQEPAAGRGGRVQTARIRVADDPSPASDPLRPGGRVMRIEVRPFDDPTRAGAEDGDVTDTSGYLASRAEVYDRAAPRDTDPRAWPDPVGSTRWYAFSLFLPTDFPTGDGKDQWLLLTQWKGLRGNSPPVALELADRTFVLAAGRMRAPLGALRRARWTRFVIGMHLSAAADGWVTVERDGRTVLPRTATPTMALIRRSGATVVDPTYLKQGLYRGPGWRQAQVAFFGPLRVAATREVVATVR